MANKCSIVRGDNGEVLSVMIPNPTIVESTTIDAEAVMGEKFKESPGNIDEAEQWAKDNNLWIEDYEEGVQYLSQGGENIVYTDNVDESIVRKVNFEVDDVQEFVKSISDFNTMSPNTPYTIKGFTSLKRNHAGSASTHHGIATKGDFAVVLEQPKIDSARTISREEVSNYMKTLGFSRLRNSNDFVNEDSSIIIGDIHEDNLILSTDGNYHIIDAAVEIEDIQLEMENIKNRSISDDSFMKAPNGNPTNLTERQWLQVRTKNFKNWFGDWETSPETASKVVDANGEPLVVYHSTSADKFYAFDPNMSHEKVMHFGTKEAADFRVRHLKTSERIKTYATFLNIRNIVRVEDIFGELAITREVLKDASEAYARGETPRTDNKVELAKIYIDEAYTGTMLEWYRDVEYGVGTLDEMRDILRKQIELLEDKKPAQTSEEIDGAIYTNTEEDVGNDSYMVFDPNQIKSAEINNGEFDSESNDIRRQVGDGTLTNSQIADSVIDRLTQTNLARKVHKLTTEEMEAKTEELGANITKQIPNGFVYNGEVYLNTETMSLDTSIHEFSHLFTDLLKQTNHQLYKRGLELIEKEGKEYIDFVKKNQPNLKGEALLEEALTQAVGEAGAKIVNKQSEFFQWMQDMWDSLKDMIGLTQYSWNEVKDMNLQQFTEAMTVDLLRGEELKFENEAQEYFTREADRLPLTLAVFNTKPFQDLQGKQVNPVTIQQLLNKTGIKQIEKDLINQILSDNYSGQKRINYDEFEATVRANIMPLERLTTTSYANYGMDNLGDGNYGEAKTLILNAPIEHGVTGHFTGDFRASGRQNIKYEAKQLNDNTWIAVEEGYESQANDNNIYQFVGTAGTKEAVEAWIENYEKPLSNGVAVYSNEPYTEVEKIREFPTLEEANQWVKDNQFKYSRDLYVSGISENININKGMFGHIRVWENKERDFKLRDESNKFDNEMYQKYGGEWQDKLNTEEKAKALDFIKRKRSENQIFYVAELQSDYFQKKNARKDLISRIIVTANEKAELAKDLNVKELKQYKDLGYRVEQINNDFILYKNNDIIVEGKEEAKYQSKDDFLKEYLTFTSTDPEILSIRQQNDSEFGKILEKEVFKREQEKLKNLSPQEKQFIASQKEWEKRMVREAIKEASLSGATSLRFPTPYTLSVIEGYITLYEEDEVKQNLRNAVDGDIIVNYLDDEYIVMYTDVPNGGTEVQIAPVRDLAKITYEEFQDMVKEDGEPDTYIESSDGNFVYYTNSLYNITETIDTKNNSAVKNSFSIENDLSETQQTVAHKYEEIAEILRKERGDNFEVVTDENGFDWYETKITLEESQNPVVAFQINATDNVGMFLSESELLRDTNGNVIGVKPEVLEEIRKEREQIETEARANGTWMKAPNGNPTNLNEEQWVTVRTKRFKYWFGDWQNDPQNASKVVDENNEPLLVYHGTNGNFTTFDSSRIGVNANAEGPGFYFTDDKSTAKGYQNNNKDNPNLFEVFLNIKNPINLNESNFKKTEIKKIIKSVIENEITFDPDGTPDFRDSFISNFVDTYSLNETRAINEVANILMGDDTKIDLIAGLGNAVGSQSLVLKAVKESLGYDGTVANGYGNRGEEGGSIFISWESNQIKSATDNVGTFANETNNIKFQVSVTTNNQETLNVNREDITTYETEVGSLNYITDINGDLVMVTVENPIETVNNTPITNPLVKMPTRYRVAYDLGEINEEALFNQSYLTNEVRDYIIERNPELEGKDFTAQQIAQGVNVNGTISENLDTNEGYQKALEVRRKVDEGLLPWSALTPAIQSELLLETNPIVEVSEETEISSPLFESIKRLPIIDSEQALLIYQESFSTSLENWEDLDTKC